MWRADIDGMRLIFHLAGINNQNFLMRDEQTGSYWQQISGAAVSGPMKGRHLAPVDFDEMTFALWKAEEPRGTVLKDVAAYAGDYAPRDWDKEMARARTVISFPQAGIKQRDIMLGVQAFGGSRAFPYDAVIRQKLVEDHVGTEPVILVVGPDGESVRVFRRRIPGMAGTPGFFRTWDDKTTNWAQSAGAALMMDDATGSQWNFQGCAISGKSAGVCLEHVEAIKDYWFDWRNYNPSTTVYRAKE